MKAWVRFTVWGVCFVVLAGVAGAHEYPLQFTPNAGYRDLVVAGYRFDGNTVVGNCSYHTAHAGSGKGGGYHSLVTRYNQTCTWDLYGNLLSVARGLPNEPPPLSINGAQTIYALNPTGASTGIDSKLPQGGFVDTPGSHYSWLTSNAYTVLQTQALYTVTATLSSDVDRSLIISAAEAGAVHAGAAVAGSTCIGETLVGATCSVTVIYDPTKLSSATGLAYDTLTIGVTSDAGQASDFVQSYTIVVKRTSD